MSEPVTAFGPDFPFAYDDWIAHPAGLGAIPQERLGARVAVIGAGAAGIVAGYELMKLGLRPIVYEAGQFGGRLRSQPFEGTDGRHRRTRRHALSASPRPGSSTIST